MGKTYKLIGGYNSGSDKLYYFDNNATTFIYDDDVMGEITKWLNCGNPSNNLHIAGICAKQKMDESRELIAKDLDVNPDEIVFTGNATEANNIIIQGTVDKHLTESPNSKFTIITTNFEHPSVLNVFKNYKKTQPRVNVEFVPIITNKDSKYYGSVDPENIREAIINAKGKVILLSVMYANNETGAIQNMKEIGEIAHKHKIFFHSDVTQAIGKYVIHPNELHMDSICFSGHKFHAPKGIGCLYRKTQCKTAGVCFGGEQEHEERPGTENPAFMAALAMALTKAHIDRESKTKKMYVMRKNLIRELEGLNVKCIEPKYGVLPNTILAILTGIKICNKSFARELSNSKRICVGVSSACQTTKNSHVLDAMDIEPTSRDKIIRISFSDYTTQEECDYLIQHLGDVLRKYRN